LSYGAERNLCHRLHCESSDDVTDKTRAPRRLLLPVFVLNHSAGEHLQIIISFVRASSNPADPPGRAGPPCRQPAC